MPTLLKQLLAGQPGTLRRSIIGIYALLALGTLAAWTWAALVFREHPVLLGTALLAYGFGLRHAVDADHIAAIDNVTRKLMQEGKRPVSVGLCFALGHSAVVVLAAAGVAATATALAGSFGRVQGDRRGRRHQRLRPVPVRHRRRQHHRAARRVAGLAAGAARRQLRGRGPRPAARQPRPAGPAVPATVPAGHPELAHGPLGFLFGLGFDTATEVSLLGISATQAAQGIPVWSIMVFPALFAAGMTLVDTTDGLLMLGAYEWARLNPERKLTYNLALTAASVAVALLVGGLEALGLLGDQLGLEGPFWAGVGTLNDNMGTLGFVIIGLFAAAWAGSVVLYRYKGSDGAAANSARS